MIFLIFFFPFLLSLSKESEGIGSFLLINLSSEGIYCMEPVKSRKNAFKKMERILGFSFALFSLIVLND